MASFELAFEQVQQLVNTFQQNYNHYMSAGYSESAARTDFIDKFFTALGWDVNHTTQTNPYEQEVKIEKSQSQQNESARKRADYAFYTAPNFKDEVFFCEAKKPSVLINQNPQHYFQTIKYGWNSGCPISVLTDFEEFIIIDCRNKPDLKFALNGRHKTYRFTDYAEKEKFAEIYWLFSREAVGNNSLQKYAEQFPKAKGKAVQKALFKGGYQAIDDSFLEYIDGIRENIAKAFKKANPELNSEQLTEATQRTVDRLVFIRFLEDKFIEAEEHVSEWQSWKDFITDCRRLDAKYNGVVFKKHFIDEADFIGADESLFLNICSDISNLNSPYDFNYIPIHILGSIYERFLGKVVRATDKRVFVEEKPEVRKAGGVYYTPKYIVDYIVKNTVGKIIEGLTPKQIAEKRFADIACGSGSFLIGVYDYLLDYHKKYYVEKLKDKTEIDGRSEDFGNVEYKDGQWLLTLKLKQDILLNNIYGVDIDAQAVEVTQLSLFLKMLEEENVSSTQIKQGALFSKVLPDLSKNIVCGNSLIGMDLYLEKIFSFEEEKALNPFDFKSSFLTVFSKGGFDCIIGNPPYVTIGGKEDMMTLPIESEYYGKHYISAKYKPNLYAFFYERALQLLKETGIVGYIIPRTFLDNKYYKNLREHFTSKFKIVSITKINYEVFENATTGGTAICLFEKQNNINNSVRVREIEQKEEFENIEFNVVEQSNILFGEYSNFTVQNQSRKDLCIKLEQRSKKLEFFCSVNNGVNTGNAANILLSKSKETPLHRKILEGKDVNRFAINWGGYWINYDKDIKSKIDIKQLNTRQNKIDLALRDQRIFNSPKIIIRQTADRIIGCLDTDKYITRHSTHCIVNDGAEINMLFLLGILNSSLINYYYRELIPEKGKAFAEVKGVNVKQMPIVPIDSPEKKYIQKQVINFVTQMLDSKKQLASAKTDSDKNFLQNKCNSLDRQIDNLVYELYELTEEEIKMVKGN
jgi:adenine-specific DNA-methyltransferase